MVLRKISEAMGKKTTGWRKLKNVELHNLYPSLNVIRVMKPMRIRKMAQLTHMDELRNTQRNLAE
jgi:hypothetical protein